MIKLFRNIRQNLLNEGKTTKYFKYAIGEIVLVVIGILIALQINNLNEGRKQRSEEIETLKNIRTDFTNAIFEFEENNAFRKRIIGTTGILYNIIHTKENPYSKHQLDSLTSELFINPTYNGQSETLNILFNSGKINIISNDSIKNALVLWPQQIEDVTEDEIYASNIHFKSLQPIVIRYVSLFDVYNKLNFKSYSTVFNYPTKSTFMSDYEGMFNDREFEGVLAAREMPVSLTLLQTEELIETAKQIIHLIDYDIKKLK